MDINELWKGGVVFVILAGFAYAVWRSVQWAGTEVVKPLVANQLKFTDAIVESNKSNSESNRINAEASVRMAECSEEITQHIKAMAANHGKAIDDLAIHVKTLSKAHADTVAGLGMVCRQGSKAT